MQVYDAIHSILHAKGQELYCLSPEASVFDAIALMARKSAGALPVLSDGRLVGIISERDYARKVILQGKSSKDTTIAEIMTAPVITVGPTETVNECMRIMTSQRIRHLPVVDHGKVIGIVSIGDLVKWIITAQEHTIHQLECFIAGAYPR
ncbi:MAG: CBS domain-containing protein [Acidobacteria bacterium]|nr:CBS domain-containing protein [Acidobacteriota bacterium]